MTPTIPSLRRLAMTAAGAATLALTAAHGAVAQGYDDRYPADEAYAPTMGGVTVIAPRRSERDSATGAPIETVFVNRVVRTDDLDLRYLQDRRILRVRVVRAARDACDELDARYPVTASDSPPCVREAVRRTMASLEY